jgi:hypothetical protein
MTELIFHTESGHITLRIDDGDLEITVAELGSDDTTYIETTQSIENVEKFIDSVKFLMGSKSV